MTMQDPKSLAVLNNVFEKISEGNVNKMCDEQQCLTFCTNGDAVKDAMELPFDRAKFKGDGKEFESHLITHYAKVAKKHDADIYYIHMTTFGDERFIIFFVTTPKYVERTAWKIKEGYLQLVSQ